MSKLYFFAISLFFIFFVIFFFLRGVGTLATRAHHQQNKLPRDENILDLLNTIRNKVIQSELERELKGEATKYQRKEPHCVHQHDENHRYFITNTWASFTYDLPVIVIGCNLNHYRMGNRFGSVLTDIACAGMSGAHIVIIDTANRTSNHHFDAFFDSIPLVVAHPHPAQNRSMALKKYLEVCVTGRFPWVS